MNLEAIFFDWGGVIADDPGDDFLINLLREVGASEMLVQDIYMSHLKDFMRGKLTETEFWNVLNDKYELNVETDIASRFTSWQGLVVNESVLNLVEQAKSKGIKTGLITNTLAPTFNILKTNGKLSEFDSIVASCEVGLIKPDSAIYEFALRQLNVSANASLFIDDKQKNLDAAERLGFKTILATNPDQIIKDASAYLV